MEPIINRDPGDETQYEEERATACHCVYPHVCFCTPAQKLLRDGQANVIEYLGILPSDRKE